MGTGNAIISKVSLKILKWKSFVKLCFGVFNKDLYFWKGIHYTSTFNGFCGWLHSFLFLRRLVYIDTWFLEYKYCFFNWSKPHCFHSCERIVIWISTNLIRSLIDSKRLSDRIGKCQRNGNRYTTELPLSEKHQQLNKCWLYRLPVKIK
jgi:hypothetical protein